MIKKNATYNWKKRQYSKISGYRIDAKEIENFTNNNKVNNSIIITPELYGLKTLCLAEKLTEKLANI